MISAPPQIPTYAQGFDRHAGESACPGLWDGLVGAWVASLGPTGSTLFDVSGRHNHGTLTNMDPATDWVPTQHGWALDFDATDDYVEIGTKTVLEFSTAFTLVVRCRHRDSTYDAGVGRRGLVNKYAASSGNRSYTYSVSHSSGKRQPLVYVSASPGSTSVTCASDFDLDTEWHLLAFTFHAGSWVHYVDGVEVKNGVSGVASLNNAVNMPFRLGVDYSGREFLGQIAYAYAFRRALTHGEISRLQADPLAVLRPRRTIRGIIPAVGGPYRAASGQAFHTGTAAGQTFITTATAGQIDGRSN